MILRLRTGSTNVLEVRGLKNIVTGELDESAVVTARILDAEGADVSGESWPKTIAHVANGLYRAMLSEQLALDVRMHYTAVITATSATGGVRRWECAVEVFQC